jgi:hypothetical protein
MAEFDVPPTASHKNNFRNWSAQTPIATATNALTQVVGFHAQCRLCDTDPLRKGAKKLLHLVDHLRFIRAVDVMVCARNANDACDRNSACESFGSCRAACCIRGKSRFSALRVVRKEVAPIVRAGKDCKDRNGDGRVFFHAEVKRGPDRLPRRQRRHRLLHLHCSGEERSRTVQLQLQVRAAFPAHQTHRLQSPRCVS